MLLFRYPSGQLMSLPTVIEQYRQLKRPSFTLGGKPLYMQAPKPLEEATRPNLEKPLKELLSSGDEITITDSTLPFSMQVILTLV
jgi:ubiquitin-activating enzyme E1 C